MPRVQPLRLTVPVFAVFAIAVAPAAAGTQRNLCTASKVEVSGLFMSAVLDCYANSTNRNGTPDARCIRQATRGLDVAFAFLERWTACETTGDGAAVTGRVLASAANLSSMVQAARPTQCAKQQFEAMAFDAAWQYTCRASAVLKGAGSSVDPACQDRASDAFFAAFDRASRRRDCGLTPSAADAIDTLIRSAAADSRTTIKPPVTTCAPIEIQALHGANFIANARLAKIENDTVPCMHADEGTVASCSFSTASGRQTGEWLESPQGNYALVGQSIALDGRPGGEYVIAARVSDAAPPACVESAGMDTMGRVAEGTELANICTVEDVLTAYNAMRPRQGWGWEPMWNFADREVCSSNNPAINPHPDGATLTRSYPRSGTGPDDTFCYIGYGAGLNDLNGAERDFLGDYYVGDGFCHYLQSSGLEVPAAKRPATFSLPVPGGVNTKSTIVWRPVNPNVVIANGGPPPVVQVFDNRTGFQNTTGASSNGAIPDLGAVGTSVTIGSITFSLALGGDSLAVGASGTPAEPDWYPNLPGNDIALGYENLQLQFATPVYAFGFDFVEPNLSMPPFGGTPGDSTFEIVMYRGAAEIGRTTFNAQDDEPGFVGVWSYQPFDRVTIIDLSGNDDDEFFGQFYIGKNPKP